MCVCVRVCLSVCLCVYAWVFARVCERAYTHTYSQCSIHSSRENQTFQNHKQTPTSSKITQCSRPDRSTQRKAISFDVEFLAGRKTCIDNRGRGGISVMSTFGMCCCGSSRQGYKAEGSWFNSGYEMRVSDGPISCVFWGEGLLRLCFACFGVFRLFVEDEMFD